MLLIQRCDPDFYSTLIQLNSSTLIQRHHLDIDSTSNFGCATSLYGYDLISTKLCRLKITMYAHWVDKEREWTQLLECCVPKGMNTIPCPTEKTCLPVCHPVFRDRNGSGQTGS